MEELLYKGVGRPIDVLSLARGCEAEETAYTAVMERLLGKNIRNVQSELDYEERKLRECYTRLVLPRLWLQFAQPKTEKSATN